MHHFKYKSGRLHAEEVAIEKIAKKVGTPCYVYSRATLERHYNAFDRAFKKAPHIVCYSVKANSNIAVLNTFAELGGGFDIVSGGELYRALKAGADPKKIVFSGVGKKEEEIEYAIKSSILMFNVESPQELRAINKVAKRLKKRAGIAIRVNPDVDAKPHPYISTGLKKNKFGISSREAVAEYIFAKKNLKNLDLIGIDCHIGSQLTEVSPFIDALKKVKKLIAKLRKEGIDIKYLDLGGGLGINYEGEVPPLPSEYGKAITAETGDLGVTLIFEPGRVIAGNSGILVSEVTYTKSNGKHNFTIVDGAMNDLARPSLYNAYHEIKAVKKNSRKKVKMDIVGPICESGDFLAKDRLLQPYNPGELLAVMSAGAYGFTMSSNYNTRRRAAEVMVDGKGFDVIRKREEYKDLVKGESIPKRKSKTRGGR